MFFWKNESEENIWQKFLAFFVFFFLIFCNTGQQACKIFRAAWLKPEEKYGVKSIKIHFKTERQKSQVEVFQFEQETLPWFQFLIELQKSSVKLSDWFLTNKKSLLVYIFLVTQSYTNK